MGELLEYLTNVQGAIVVLAEIEAIRDAPAGPAASDGSTSPNDIAPSTPPTDCED